MFTITLTAGMIGLGILIALVVGVGGVVLIALGAAYLVRNRAERQAGHPPRYSEPVAGAHDPTAGALESEFDDRPQYASELSSIAEDVPESDRDASTRQLWLRERRRSVALIVVGVVLIIVGAVLLTFLVVGLLD